MTGVSLEYLALLSLARQLFPEAERDAPLKLLSPSQEYIQYSPEEIGIKVAVFHPERLAQGWLLQGDLVVTTEVVRLKAAGRFWIGYIPQERTFIVAGREVEEEQ